MSVCVLTDVIYMTNVGAGATHCARPSLTTWAIKALQHLVANTRIQNRYACPPSHRTCGALVAHLRVNDCCCLLCVFTSSLPPQVCSSRCGCHHWPVVSECAKIRVEEQVRKRMFPSVSWFDCVSVLGALPWERACGPMATRIKPK